MSEQIVIDARYCGPPASGHGGYVSGILAGIIGGRAEVTLRSPPPLGRPLEVVRDGTGVRLLDGDVLVAEGVAAGEVELELPEAVSLEEAVEGANAFPLYDRHPYPTCFGCGPDRVEGDGLRIFAGPVPGRDLVAAPWTPDASLGEDGVVRPELVWTALDCPSGLAVMQDPGQPVLLGRYAAELVAPVEIGRRCVAAGWQFAADGRKLSCGSALFSDDGRVLAYARSTWIRRA